MKNLPNQPTEPVGDGTNGLSVSESRDEPSVDDGEDRALGLDRGVRGLVEDAAHLSVALWTAVTVVHSRALLIARAGAHPGRELFLRRKRGGTGTDFSDDLLRGIDAEAGHFGQALHRVVVVREQLRHLLIELGEVVFDQAQFVQCGEPTF